MPFAGPGTALAVRIDAESEESFVADKTVRAVACQEPSSNYQSLPPRLNN
jgi:hypothetical protein